MCGSRMEQERGGKRDGSMEIQGQIWVCFEEVLFFPSCVKWENNLQLFLSSGSFGEVGWCVCVG